MFPGEIRNVVLDGREKTDMRPLLKIGADGILLEDGDLHPAVRTSALLLVGHHGDNADREWIRDLYNGEFTPWVRRAILYAIRHLPKSERNHF